MKKDHSHHHQNHHHGYHHHSSTHSHSSHHSSKHSSKVDSASASSSKVEDGPRVRSGSKSGGTHESASQVSPRYHPVPTLALEGPRTISNEDSEVDNIGSRSLRVYDDSRSPRGQESVPEKSPMVHGGSRSPRSHEGTREKSPRKHSIPELALKSPRTKSNEDVEVVNTGSKSPRVHGIGSNGGSRSPRGQEGVSEKSSRVHGGSRSPRSHEGTRGTSGKSLRKHSVPELALKSPRRTNEDGEDFVFVLSNSPRQREETSRKDGKLLRRSSWHEAMNSPDASEKHHVRSKSAHRSQQHHASLEENIKHSHMKQDRGLSDSNHHSRDTARSSDRQHRSRSPSGNRKLVQMTSLNVIGMKENGRDRNQVVPSSLFCPLSKVLLTDPVVAADGYSYQRGAIEEWLRNGKRTSPKTGVQFDINRPLVPNRTLVLLIEELLQTGFKSLSGEFLKSHPQPVESEQSARPVFSAAARYAACEELIQKSVQHMSRNEWDLALECSTQALELNHKRVKAVAIGAVCFLMLNRPRESFRMASRWIQLEPTSEAYMLRCRARQELNDINGAVMDANVAIDIQPKNVAALTERAKIYASFGHMGKAKADLGEALQVDPNHEPAKSFLERIRWE